MPGPQQSTADSPLPMLARRALIYVPILLVFAWSALIAANRELTPLESVLLQFFGLAVGVWASFSAGMEAGRKMEASRTQASARSAFRRVTRVYEALGRLIESIETRRDVLYHHSGNGSDVRLSSVEAALDLLGVQVTEQLGTANDAMEDWRDLVPDQVRELEQKAEGQST